MTTVPVPEPGFNLSVTWDVIIKIIQTVVVPILGYGSYVLRGIRNELRTVNSRISTLETKAEEHEKLDNDRYDRTERDLDRIHREAHRGYRPPQTMGP